MSSNDLDQDTPKSTDRVSTTENDISEELSKNTKLQTSSEESLFQNYKSEVESLEKANTSKEELTDEKQKSEVNTNGERDIIPKNDNNAEDEVTEERPSSPRDIAEHLIRNNTFSEDEEVEEGSESTEKRQSIEEFDEVNGLKQSEGNDDVSEDMNFLSKDLASEDEFHLSKSSETLNFSKFSGGSEDKVRRESITSNPSIENIKQKSVRLSVDLGKSVSLESTFTLSSMYKLKGIMESTSELVEEESEESEGEVEDEHEDVQEQDEDNYQTIDRAMYYQMYALFQQRHRKEKMQNNFLQARLAGYYIRRKMLYVLREQTSHAEEMQSKYERELDALEELIETSDTEKRLNQGQLYHLQQKRDAKLTQLNELFEMLQNGELEYGKSLTFDKTGKNNMDKVTERFIKRQKNQVTLLAQMRLKFIKLRNKMQDKLKALDALDNLGPGFRIMDFVQLKADNRDLKDKLEEKEGELSLLRKGCQNTMQVLAHIREKSAAVDINIQQRKDDLESITADYEDAREQLHCLRHSRDEVRNGTKNLKLQYGLLVNKKALLDMEHSVNELEALKEKLENTKAEYNIKLNQVRAVRKNIELLQETKRKEDEKLKADQMSSDSSL